VEAEPQDDHVWFNAVALEQIKCLRNKCGVGVRPYVSVSGYVLVPQVVPVVCLEVEPVNLPSEVLERETFEVGVVIGHRYGDLPAAVLRVEGVADIGDKDDKIVIVRIWAASIDIGRIPPICRCESSSVSGINSTIAECLTDIDSIQRIFVHIVH
jgi:hypothetical protein